MESWQHAVKDRTVDSRTRQGKIAVVVAVAGGELARAPNRVVIHDGQEGGLQIGCAIMMATREDINPTLLEQRPPQDSLELLRCPASEGPKNHQEAMRSGPSELWKDSLSREHFGLLDAGTFRPI